MTKRDKVREQIKKILDEMISQQLTAQVNQPDAFYPDVSFYADQILAIPDIAIVDREAELPDPESSSLDPQYEGEILQYGRVCGEMGYRRAQQDMVKKDWVKEIKNG